ncbi:MAG: site-specific DNA-methyltransferase [Opitutae bacterium]|nr:site-specific DNA-methyltransferase [Opitutae bacterium]
MAEGENTVWKLAEGVAAYGEKAARQDEISLAYSDASSWIYCGDSIKLLSAIAEKYPAGKFDAIFADPPYFLSNGGFTCRAGKRASVDKGKWDKSGGIDQDHEFNLRWLSLCQKVLNKNGTIWVSGTQHVIFSVGHAMQQLGFKILNMITWEKPNPPPNLSCRFFTHSTEILIWAAKNDKARHYFDYDQMRAENGGKQMKSVWRFMPPGNSEKGFGKKHPTQKPLALIDRCLRASVPPGGWVLDPFLGSGTTAVAAKRLKMYFAGAELDPDYVEVARQRVSAAAGELL